MDLQVEELRKNDFRGRPSVMVRNGKSEGIINRQYMVLPPLAGNRERLTFRGKRGFLNDFGSLENSDWFSLSIHGKVPVQGSMES